MHRIISNHHGARRTTRQLRNDPTTRRGGMGEVWLAREPRLHRNVAIKILPADLTRDSDRVARFEREARAVSALNHPNVCTVYGLGETPDGQQYLVMEYIQGATLRKRLDPRLSSIEEALDVAAQTAFALSAAHSSGIVHRDIKPENIMVRPDGITKVLDFGLAKLMPHIAGDTAPETDTHTALHTAAGVVLGTLPYMSPEQTRGDIVDARTDVWSLGVILYESLTGQRPFTGRSHSDVVAAILTRHPVPITHFLNAPAELDRITMKALRKDREQRYQTAKDLMLDLQSLASRKSIYDEPTPHVEEDEPVHEAPRPHPWRLPKWLTMSSGQRATSADSVERQDGVEQRDVIYVDRTVSVFRAHGSSAYMAFTDKGTFTLAKSSSACSTHEQLRWVGAYIVTFDVEVADGLPWAAVDEIAVVVNAFRPLPPYEPAVTLGLMRPHKYFVEIDMPHGAGRERFVAQAPRPRQFDVIRLFARLPEAFLLGITARTPGIYEFSVHLTASYRDVQRETIVLKSATCLFDGLDAATVTG
jgi:serine/threonine protein kinase